MNIKLLILLSILIMNVECSFFRKGAKKGLNVRYVGTCETHTDSTAKCFINFNKFNRTHIGISFNITLLEPCDSSYRVEIERMKWGDGGWKRNYLVFQRNDACVALYIYLGPIWAAYLAAAHAEQGCPVKPGFYYFDYHNFDSLDSPVAIEPGKFYTILHILKQGKVVLCIDLEYESFEIYT